MNITIFVMAILILLISPLQIFSQSIPYYEMKLDTVAGGIEDMGSTNYDLVSTLGQISETEYSSSQNYTNFAGFVPARLGDAELPPFIGGPDLTGAWTGPLSQKCRNIKSGQRCSIQGTFIVFNIGNEDALNFSVQFYLSDNDTYGEGNILLKSFQVGKVKTMKNKKIQLKYNFPIGEAATGKYITAILDQEDALDERNEGNNTILAGPVR